MDKIKVDSLKCIHALANVAPAASGISINKDGLDAVVTVAYDAGHGKADKVEVPLSLLDAAYVGMVKLWPRMKEVKDTVRQNLAKARDDKKAEERKAKEAEKQAAKDKAKAGRGAAAKAKRDQKEKEKQERADIRAKEKADREAKKKAEQEAKEKAKQEAEAKRKQEEEAKKKADTAKATEAAKKLSKAGKLPK